MLSSIDFNFLCDFLCFKINFLDFFLLIMFHNKLNSNQSKQS